MKNCQDFFHSARVDGPRPATQYCETCVCSFCDVCADAHDKRYPDKACVPVVVEEVSK